MLSIVKERNLFRFSIWSRLENLTPPTDVDDEDEHVVLSMMKERFYELIFIPLRCCLICHRGEKWHTAQATTMESKSIEHRPPLLPPFACRCRLFFHISSPGSIEWRKRNEKKSSFLKVFYFMLLRERFEISLNTKQTRKSSITRNSKRRKESLLRISRVLLRYFRGEKKKLILKFLLSDKKNKEKYLCSSLLRSAVYLNVDPK